MRYLLISILLLGLCGCAGTGRIWEWEYDSEKDELTLERITEFDGKNIKCNTEKGAGMETKNLELPAVPFKF